MKDWKIENDFTLKYQSQDMKIRGKRKSYYKPLYDNGKIICISIHQNERGQFSFDMEPL